MIIREYVSKTQHFYPRSPCGERPGKVKLVEPGLVFLSTLSLRRATPLCLCGFSAERISIHALLAESDAWSASIFGGISISIHALLAESDVFSLYGVFCACIFLSTLSLRRATPCGGPTGRPAGVFLSTLSLRRATARRASRQQPAGISIHALLAESDSKSAQNSGALLRI